jgi:protein phosphatase
MQAFAATHTGPRFANEDSYRVDTQSGFFAVADGVSAEPGGAIASAIAVDSLARFFSRVRDAGDRGVAESRMKLAVGFAYRRVVERSVGLLSRMATTLAAVWVTDRRAVIAHVGDSPVLIWRDGRLERLTTDHSFREEWRAAVNVDWAHSPLSGALTRAISANCNARPDVTSLELLPGDVLLLCTDGVSRTLGEPAMAALAESTPVDALASALVHRAIAIGGRDNATALVCAIDRDRALVGA